MKNEMNYYFNIFINRMQEYFDILWRFFLVYVYSKDRSRKETKFEKEKNPYNFLVNKKIREREEKKKIHGPSWVDL